MSRDFCFRASQVYLSAERSKNPGARCARDQVVRFPHKGRLSEAGTPTGSTKNYIPDLP